MSILTRAALACLVLFSLACGPVLARDQWSTNHGGNNPPIDPRFMPGGSMSGYVPKVSPDFWKGQLANRIPAGTVLTAIFEDDLSSAKNKPGDTFALTLEDGFVSGGKMLVPPKSKIIGTVMNASSAKFQRNGAPGTMEVSLQTLVFPDGSHYPIFGFIDGNPNSKHKKPPKMRHAGQNIADYGESLKGMALSFVTGPGYMMKKLQRGLEFTLDKGDAVPVRLTRSIDVKPPAVAPLAVGADSSPARAAIPGLLADPTGPIQVPGFVPGVSGFSSMNAPMPPGAPTFPPRTAPDPNAVFHQPVAPHSLNDLPDPF